MNATVIPMPGVAPRRVGVRWGRLFLWAFGAGFLFLLAMGAVLVASFWPGGEVRAMRQIVLEAVPGTWERQVEFGIGRLPVWLARQGLFFVDLEPEARAALGAIHSGDVVVFQRRRESRTTEVRRDADGLTSEAWNRIREEMEGRGWEVVVQVLERKEIVGVFMPREQDTGSRVRACVFVLDGNDLVIVSARADFEPLIALALAQEHGWAARTGGVLGRLGRR